jgi:aspartate kinase
MRVYKFGGASIKSAAAVNNLIRIVEQRPPGALVVVVSAMGKTTNAMEILADRWYRGDDLMEASFQQIMTFHQEIADELLGQGNGVLDPLRNELWQLLSCLPPHDMDLAYDSVVQYGELLSSALVAASMEAAGMPPRLLDARRLIISDEQHREAAIDWKATNLAIRSTLHQENKYDFGLILSQGFIAASERGIGTTLGREGSDFSAAIFAHCLDASELVIWKDVPGLLNADPKHHSDARLIPSISYREAIELAYYGASIIHPKTIKPLQNKQIPLRVKSFLNPEGSGSLISGSGTEDALLPSFIHKVGQVLMSISPRDFSFMDEKVLSSILDIFAGERIKLNLMQNSAITFSVCFDYHEAKFSRAVQSLSSDFSVRYNMGLELLTVRHYSEELINILLRDKETLLEQRSRTTAQFVIKP